MILKTNRLYNVVIGIALTFEKNHIEFIKAVEHAINTLDIVVFWVKQDEVIIETKVSNLKILNNISQRIFLYP